MTDLGALGTEHEALDVTFGWFGTRVRVNPNVSDITLVDFLEKSEAVDETQDVRQAMTLTKQLVRDCIHPDDFDAYWQVGNEHRQGILDHMKVADAIIGLVGKDLSALPPDSSPGPTRTDESEVDFLQRVTAGRPDIELGLVTDLAARRAG